MFADNNSKYHVVLEGRRVGPYNRRTIVGMRIKQTLTSEHVLVDTQGKELTVGDLLGTPAAFNPSRSTRRIDIAVESVLSDGVVLEDPWSHASTKVAKGSLIGLELPPRSGRVLISAEVR